MARVPSVNNSWKTVLVATAFNLLFEYSIRGINNLLVQPVLPFILFTVYFTLFTMLNELITRYRLRDYHLILASFFFGTAYQFLVSGAALLPPLTLGVNWISLLFVVAVWWGILQSVITFYISNRICPRDWNHELSKAGWVAALLINCLMVLLFQASGAIPRANMLQITLMVSIMIISALAFKATLPNRIQRSSSAIFNRSSALDFLSALTVIIFFVCAVFLTFDSVRANTSNVNATSTSIVIGWTTILAFIVLAYRLYYKKPISV
jgi:hypothetical protein